MDPRLHTLLPLALGRLRSLIVSVLELAVVQLDAKASASQSNAQRQSLMTADRELRLRASRIVTLFERELQALTDDCLNAYPETRPTALVNTDWAALSLVDHDQIERNVQADRLALALMGSCQTAFDALSGYVSVLVDDASPERNPLRPKLITKALLDGMNHSAIPEESIRTISGLLPGILGPKLSECFEQITADMRKLGLQTQGMTVQKASQSRIPIAPKDARSAEPAQLSRENSPVHTVAPPSRAIQAVGDMFGVPVPPAEISSGQSMMEGCANSELHHLLKQLSRQTSATAQDPPASNSGDVRASDQCSDLMAVNQIRANHDELVRASGGAAIDQMVIDIVAALFDQVLADPKVAPEIARQIARLQMPVLRVALGDMNFFRSRKHPVRRLVNRMASLSAAYDDYSQGPGAACLERITQLVNDIVDGDFERMEIYERKVRELEASIEAEAVKENGDSSDVTTLLSAKEAELRIQQRYTQVMQRELVDVALPDFVREFLSTVWSRVQVAATSLEGVDSALAQRMRTAGRELALSVQPKGHPKMRQAFLVQLPKLMKDIHDGLNLIQLPEPSKQAFFAELLPAHAGCLKAMPTHELTQRLLEQRLRQIESIPIPTREETADDTIPSPLDSLQGKAPFTPEPLFSANEIKQSGLLTEASLDINLDLADPAQESDPTLADLDINLDVPPPPSAGLQLIHHIQKGTPYHMVMQGKWQKVRLTWVSEGRSFFIFTAGHLHKQTISLTGRTLARMCESGRFKAFEQAELIERATVRARKQLAALGVGAPA